MAYGIIDIGSNTIRLCVYKKHNNEFIRLLNNKETAGLGGYKKDGFMPPEGVDKACDVLNSFKDILSIITVKKLFVFTTASLRNITNSEEVVKEIEKRTGFEIDVISGEVEAKLGFEGASRANDLTNGLLIDIGGGSTELLEYKNGEITNCTSLQIGSLSLYSTFVSSLLASKKEQLQMREYIFELLQGVDFIQENSIDTIVGTGGSIRTARKLCKKRLGITEKSFEYGHLHELLKFVNEDKKQCMDMILKVAPDRVHTAVPGMIIADEIAKYVHAKKFIVSKLGLREGYLYSKVKGD